MGQIPQAEACATRPAIYDIDLRLTRDATGHIVLRKDQIKLAKWDQTYEK
jgi:hypothetical protein